MSDILPDQVKELLEKADQQVGYAEATDTLRNMGKKLARAYLALTAENERLRGMAENDSETIARLAEAATGHEKRARDAERRLREIAEIAGNADKRGWLDFDRIATLATENKS